MCSDSLTVENLNLLLQSSPHSEHILAICIWYMMSRNKYACSLQTLHKKCEQESQHMWTAGTLQYSSDYSLQKPFLTTSVFIPLLLLYLPPSTTHIQCDSLLHQYLKEEGFYQETLYKVVTKEFIININNSFTDVLQNSLQVQDKSSITRKSSVHVCKLPKDLMMSLFNLQGLILANIYMNQVMFTDKRGTALQFIE